MVFLNGEPICTLCHLSYASQPLRRLAILLVLAPAALVYAADEPTRVAFVNKVENEAQIVSVDVPTTAIVGTPVHMKDELRTGADGRLQVTFRDNTVLTLGEKASVVIDCYVYDPEQGIGETVLQATKGAFRFATGRLKELSEKKIAISTPSPISACAAPSSGADLSMRNMVCCCSRAKSV
jgi:FecR protein